MTTSMLKTKDEILASDNISATRLLSIYEKFQMNDSIPPHVLENATRRGLAVHDWIAKQLLGQLDAGLNPDLSDWSEAFNDFNKTIYEQEVVFVEQGIEYGLVKGILDAVFYDVDNDVYFIRDWKNTSKFAKEKTELQMQTYGWLLEKYLINEKGISKPNIYLEGVHLKKGGTFKVYGWEYDAVKFHTLLNAYMLIEGVSK